MMEGLASSPGCFESAEPGCVLCGLEASVAVAALGPSRPIHSVLSVHTEENL